MEGVEEGTVWDGGGHRYQLEKVVGHGAFGIVWRARAEDGEVVAIKKVMLDRRYHNRELQMMKVMDHDNVIRLRHYFEKAGRKKEETFLHLVMDYLPETIRSVALKHQKRSKRFHEDHIKAYLWQTFKALEYIHERRICHRDIKPDNLLCDPQSLRCRLCDFGCSKVLVKGQPNVSYICSRYYRAPELMFGATEYSVAVDVWSVGTILMELLLGHLPYQGQDSTQQHLVEIMKLLGTPTDRDLQAMRATCCADDLPRLKPYPWERMFPAHTPAEAIDLAQRLLKYDPDQRLSATQSLAQPFFDGADLLVEGSGGASAGASATPVAPHDKAAAPKTALTQEQWEARLVGQFDELRKAMGPQLKTLMSTTEQALSREASRESSEVLGTVVNSVRHELSSALRERDRAATGLRDRLLHDAHTYQLPLKPPASSAADGGAAATSSAAEEVEAARVAQQQLADVKAAQRALAEAIAEKDGLAARVKAAQKQLQAAHGAADGAVQGTDETDRSRGGPHFGRRAPPMPTRQGTIDQPGISPAVRKPPGMQLQTDNLGQVQPLGAFSPATPAGADVRPGSSGRRRSRLGADGAKEEGHVDGEPDAQ